MTIESFLFLPHVLIPSFSRYSVDRFRIKSQQQAVTRVHVAQNMKIHSRRDSCRDKPWIIKQKRFEFFPG